LLRRCFAATIDQPLAFLHYAELCGRRLVVLTGNGCCPPTSALPACAAACCPSPR